MSRTKCLRVSMLIVGGVGYNGLMKLIKESVALEELKQMAEKMFGGLVKVVVDLDKQVMMVDAELHADEEMKLIELGSRQKDLWGINLYPDQRGKDGFLEYDSVINIRPSQGNVTRGVDDKVLQDRIRKLVDKLVRQ